MNEVDISFVQEIAQTTWAATYEGIIPKHIQERFLQAAYSNERLTCRLQTSPFLVATVGESLIGFANFSNVNEEGQAELLAIYLLPTAQHKGNKIGRQFYSAKGFQQVEEFDELFEGHMLKTIRLILPLAKK